MRRLRILTWHTHGSYLYYLTQVPHDFLVLSKPERPPGYAGRSGQFAWGDNVLDLPAEAAARAQFDCILFQDDHHYLHDQYHYLDDQYHYLHYLHDQYRYLTPAQRRLAVIEAMLTGLPIVALATTEMATVVRNDESGYCDTEPATLVVHMQRLLDDPQLARRLGQGARRVAQERFHIARFVADWQQTLAAIASV